MPLIRVLVVDDDPVLLRALTRQLGRQGADVVPARSVRAAVALLRGPEPRPDLIITELDLPGGPGEELLREVRGDEALAAIPVVAMSATPTEQPFDLRLEKPFAGGELRAALCLARAAGGLDDVDPRVRERLLPAVDGRPGPARRLGGAALARMVRSVLDAAPAPCGA